VNKITPNSPPIATLQHLAANAVIALIFIPVLHVTKNEWWMVPYASLMIGNTIGMLIRMHYAVWRKND